MATHVAPPLTYLGRAVSGTIQENILRGVPLHVTMKRFGAVWMRAPNKLSDASRNKLWELSIPCKALDRFISHTWHTSGLQKYIGLLLSCAYKRAVAASVLCSLCLGVLDYLGCLPRTRQIERRIGQWEGTLLLPACQTIAVPLCAIVALLCTAGMPKLFAKQQMCFLDVTCIHQVDMNLQREAVYSLSGFLKRSDEMYVMWSPPYFQRMWCVFEMAAFRALNKHGKLTFAPMYREMTALIWFLTLSVVHILNTSSADRNMPQAGKYLPLAGLALTALPIQVVLTHALRRMMYKKKDLERQLQEFDVRKAECLMETDKEFIFECITEWYGGLEEFNNHVRGDLRKEVLDLVRNTTLPYGYMMLIMLPPFSMHVEVLTGLMRSGVPAVEVLSYGVAVLSVDLFVLPLGVYTLMKAVERFAEPCKYAVVNMAFSLFLHMGILTPLLLWAIFAGLAFSIHLGASIIYSLVSGLLLWCFHGPKMCRKSSQRQKEEEPEKAPQQDVNNYE